MGIFQYNYNKEGPGIDKNAPRKKGLALLFSVLKDNFWEICKLNMMYIIASIPMIAVLTVGSIPLITSIMTSYSNATSMVISSDVSSQYYIGLLLTFVFTSLILIGSGPASASMAYIIRNNVRGEHIWLWSDFKAKYKENFKQGMIVSVISTIIISIMLFAIRFYSGLIGKSPLFTVLVVIIAIFLFLFVILHFYIYQIMVTFTESIKSLYRNAFLLSLSTLVTNFILTAIICVLCYMIYTRFQSGFSTVITVFLVVGVFRFPIECYATENIQKLVLDNMKKEEPIEVEEETQITEE